MPANPDDLLLVLIDLVLELKLATAARARIGQRHPNLLIDMIGDRPVRPGAVVLTAPAPRPRRVLLRIALGKRRRLTLPRPPRLLELPPQPRVLGQQPLVLRAQPRAAGIAPSTTQAHSATPSDPTLTHWPTIHDCRIPCTQQETSHPLRRSDRFRPALTQYPRPRQTSANSVEAPG